jgi:hypothetical protein
MNIFRGAYNLLKKLNNSLKEASLPIGSYRIEVTSSSSYQTYTIQQKVIDERKMSSHDMENIFLDTIWAKIIEFDSLVKATEYMVHLKSEGSGDNVTKSHIYF